MSTNPHCSLSPTACQAIHHDGVYEVQDAAFDDVMDQDGGTHA